MKDYQQRAIDEKAELDEKRVKLDAFLLSPLFSGLLDLEQGRLLRQSSAMRLYSDILAERISAFSE
jgi:hypothetical protein